jgi:hypothetical protein
MSFVVSQSPFIYLWSINLCWSTMSIYISWLPKFCWFIIFICVHDHLTLKLLLIHYFALCLHDHQSFNKTLVIQNSAFIFIIIKTLLIQSFNISQSSCNLCFCIVHVSFVEYKLTYLFNNVQGHKNAHSKMERKRSKIKLIREIFNHYTQVNHFCQNLERKLCREISSHMLWHIWFNSMYVLLQKAKLCSKLSHTT